MGSLIVRDLDDSLIDKLKERAARNQRSAEAEHREILRRALDVRSNIDVKELAARIRALTANRDLTPSSQIIRETRDEN